MDVKMNCIVQEEFTKEKHENWLQTKVETGEMIYMSVVRDAFL